MKNYPSSPLILAVLQLLNNPTISIPFISAINTSLTTTPQCIVSPSWVTPSFIPGDCDTALDNLYSQEVVRYTITPFEFITTLSSSLNPSLVAQRTPRGYRYNSCTVAIIMLRDVEGIRFEMERESPREDRTSYEVIERAGIEVRDVCLSIVGEEGQRALGYVNPVGFNVVGSRRAVGVFLWDSNSAINRYFFPEVVLNSTVGKFTNGSDESL